MNDELKKIKKYYGEEMMHFCRENFSTLFEEEGTVLSILENNFAHSHELFSDIKKEEKEYYFKNYIYSFYDIEEKQMITKKTPFELMEEAGYILYECKSEEEIQSFKKYYKHQEELCTFHGNRLQTNYVFFAVKKNVDEIKREDFSKPKRQDEYGTSVISIQFTRGEVNTLSIKNRYNHTVNNPDATFSNNLENIIPGLTDSFEREYGFTINQNKNGFELGHYVKARDGKFYKYNREIDNIYYGPNNIVIDEDRNVITKYLQKEKYLVFDQYVLDIVNKLFYIHSYHYDDEAFFDIFKNIEKIEIFKNSKNNKEVRITSSDKEIGMTILTLDKENKMIAFQNDTIIRLANSFLRRGTHLKKISMKKVKILEDETFGRCYNLEEIDFPSLEVIGSDSLSYANVKKLFLPNVRVIGAGSLQNNSKIETLELENLQEIKEECFMCCPNLTNIILPNVKKIGSFCFSDNKVIENLYLPKVEEIGYAFHRMEEVKRVYAPKLKKYSYTDIFIKTNFHEESIKYQVTEAKEKVKRFTKTIFSNTKR